MGLILPNTLKPNCWPLKMIWLHPRAMNMAEPTGPLPGPCLAKLYLNYEVYTGQKKYTECTSVCQKILASGYQLDPAYKNLFLADNHLSPEIIFPITYDGINTRTWGGTTFIIRAGIGGSMNPAASGVASGWGGSRTTRQLVEKFPADLTGIVTDFNPGETVKYKRCMCPARIRILMQPILTILWQRV